MLFLFYKKKIIAEFQVQAMERDYLRLLPGFLMAHEHQWESSEYRKCIPVVQKSKESNKG